MRADIVVGAVLPDYELTEHTGKHLKAFGAAGARSHDLGAHPGRILLKGSAAGRGSGPTSPRDGKLWAQSGQGPESASL